jgi:hypothetical protein
MTLKTSVADTSILLLCSAKALKVLNSVGVVVTVRFC